MIVRWVGGNKEKAKWSSMLQDPFLQGPFLQDSLPLGHLSPDVLCDLYTLEFFLHFNAIYFNSSRILLKTVHANEQQGGLGGI